MRPNRHELRRKEQKFKMLVGGGASLRAACLAAKLSPYRALDMATDQAFWAEVGAIAEARRQATFRRLSWPVQDSGSAA